jgi:hypothetical protein
MVTYLELGSEPVWGQQKTPTNMLELFVKPMRTFYGMGPALIGAPGDNNHLRGRHRSRDWDLTSAYCTNRSYATTDARDKAGDGTWYRAVDVGITGTTLHEASRRLDGLVRSGADGGKVAEWFGTFDGKTVVGWFEGHASSSDESHLFHLHVGVWTKWANDAGLMTLLYATITGQTLQEDYMAQMLVRFGDDPAEPDQVWLCDGQLRRRVKPEWMAGTPAGGPIGNNQSHFSGNLGNLGNLGKVLVSSGDKDVWGIDVATLQGGSTGISGPVELTDASVDKVAEAVADEAHNRLAE